MAKVMNYSRAARLNRGIMVADLATGVSLGIRDAFSREGKLVPNWAKSLEDLHHYPGETEPGPPKHPLAPWLNRLPVIRRKRNV